MAYLFGDGFDTLSVAADITQRWDSGVVALISTANTAFNVGGAISIGSTGAITKAFSSNESTVYFSFRHKQASGTIASNYLSVLLYETSGVQISIRFAEDGSVGVYTAAAGTLIGTAAPSGTFASATWDSWQVRVVIHNTAGSVEVRKNGSATPIINLSGINTRNGTTNAYANKIQWVTSLSTAAHQLDDIFVWSGSGAVPNTWIGDLRALTDAPSATMQSQWSKSPTTQNWGTSSNTVNSGPVAGVIRLVKFTAPYTGSVSQQTLTVTNAITGKVNVAIYSDASGAPGSLLVQSTEQTLTAFTGALTFSHSLSVTKGTAYWIAVWSNQNVQTSFGAQNNGQGTTSTLGTAIGGTVYSQSLTYAATFPTTLSGPTASSTLPPLTCVLDLTGIDAVSLVNDSTQDGDTSYVYSSTVGQEDIYSFGSLASQGATPVSIVGVNTFAVLKRSDSGSRTVSVHSKSGATDTSLASSGSVSLAYQTLGGFQATDPNTGAAWTTSGIDAQKASLKVDA